jgi:hypothetical protein
MVSQEQRRIATRLSHRSQISYTTTTIMTSPTDYAEATQQLAEGIIGPKVRAHARSQTQHLPCPKKYATLVEQNPQWMRGDLEHSMHRAIAAHALEDEMQLQPSASSSNTLVVNMKEPTKDVVGTLSCINDKLKASAGESEGSDASYVASNVGGKLKAWCNELKEIRDQRKAEGRPVDLLEEWIKFLEASLF